MAGIEVYTCSWLVESSIPSIYATSKFYTLKRESLYITNVYRKKERYRIK